MDIDTKGISRMQLIDLALWKSYFIVSNTDVNSRKSCVETTV